MRTLIRRRVGNPTAAVIFLTCLFFPSFKTIDIHESGIDFLNLTGGFLSGTTGTSSKILALQDFVL